MSDTNFTTGQASAPASAIENRVLRCGGSNTDGSVELEQSTLLATGDGKITNTRSSKLRFNQVVDIVTENDMQTVNATTSLTLIDLNLGADIILNQSVSTIIQFSNIPTEGVKFFGITRIKDATTTPYSIEFIHNPPSQAWFREGGVGLVLPSLANCQDYIIGFVDSAGNTITFNSFNNYNTIISVAEAMTARNIQAKATQDYVPMAAQFTKNVKAVVDGALVTTMEDGTLNATDIVFDGNETFTSIVELFKVLISRRNVRHVFKTASDSPTLTIDLRNEDFISLNHDADITDINLITGDPDYFTWCLIWRIKDFTDTPRHINLNPALFEYDLIPILGQSNGSVDFIFIQSAGGYNFVHATNGFKR